MERVGPGWAGLGWVWWVLWVWWVSRVGAMQSGAHSSQCWPSGAARALARGLLLGLGLLGWPTPGALPPVLTCPCRHQALWQGQ